MQKRITSAGIALSALVTGDTGFKGSWLVGGLLGLGATVTGYSLVPRRVAWVPEDETNARYHQQLGDVLDRATLERSLGASGSEVVFHLAAQALVSVGHADPHGTFLSNIMGTVNVLDAVERCPSVRCVVVVTSDKVYEPRVGGPPHEEGDRLGGNDPYSASKACAELVARTYAYRFRRDGRVAIATARAGNVIGGGDWSRDRLIPDLVRALDRGQKAVLRSPDATRPWQHVTDPIRGYIMLANHLRSAPTDSGDAWNFGPTDREAWTVRRVAERFVRSWGYVPDDVLEYRPDPMLPETSALAIDSSRARRTLGWAARHDTGRAIDLTAQWYRAAAMGAGHVAVMQTQMSEAIRSLSAA
ncbi:MAG: CDP-glucose 4,6-dehydratase [Proteobacteria bacterium]|jgi:CDP-glucose 4,6-dehydratase|nr:CDP-glucose 4,6-dehydratase [Pseudomonadota bacterium]